MWFWQGHAMGQQLQTRLRSWRSQDSCDSWLSLLIDTMEEVSRPEIRAMPCDISLLAAVNAQLARPASRRIGYASDFSLRN
jgi:hypothetical protein